MEFFDKYHSNTIGASANQLFFCPEDKNKVYTGRIFYKIYASGKYNYSFLFSNIIDSTYWDGSISRHNMLCDKWEIVDIKVGYSETGSLQEMVEVKDMKTVKPDPTSVANVGVGQLFYTIPVELDIKKDQYLCLEVSFKGEQVPYHEESVLPVFRKIGEAWVPCKQMPIPAMIGCDRPVEARVAYMGDSITQGIGPDENTYEHWNAFVSSEYPEYSHWNLGIGYSRSEDGVDGGILMYKATKNDIVFLCYGVNDIIQKRATEDIKESLRNIIATIHNKGVKLIVQTIPPFNYEGDDIIKWKELNRFIKEEMSEYIDFLFDNTPALCVSEEEPHMAKYGDHPNGEGCRIWAEALLHELKKRADLL